MSRKKQSKQSQRSQRQTKRQWKRRRQHERRKNRLVLFELLTWFVLLEELFTEDTFHGNTQWKPGQVAAQAVIWSWQGTKNVTDAFDDSLEICQELGLKEMAHTYPTFMNALHRYQPIFTGRLRKHYQSLAEDAGEKFFHTHGWVLIGFDGSRATAPRTASNEQAFCAPNYGKGKRAKYGKKKSQGLRRQRNEQNPPQPPAPQAWVTMLWHMGLHLPWTWRLGPSNASERDHVKEILQQEEFPQQTLFCGDAGFVGHPLWSEILAVPGANFLIRVGANVELLSEHADVKKSGDGQVLCWPKGQMNSGEAPLPLRLVRVKIGKTKMWMLTSVRNPRRLGKKQIVRFYKMRWGIEVEFRGLKQTLDKHTLRSRNSDRLLVELDWSIRGMAYAELLALREQIRTPKPKRGGKSSKDYDPKDRSLAKTMRVLRQCMRKLDQDCDPETGLLYQLSTAKIQRYRNRTDKRARYRPKNPDKKPLGDPTVRKMTAEERKKLKEYQQNVAA